MPSLLITSIYVLLLNENKYFISKMEKEQISMLVANKYNNLTQIFDNGIEWLTTYPIIDTMNIVGSDNIDVDSIVKYHMVTYGIDNVRGGKYHKMILDDDLLDELKNNLQNNNKIDYLENFNTIKDIDEQIEELNKINEESSQLANKYEPLINLTFCFDKQITIFCYYEKENAIHFNIIKDDINDLIKQMKLRYNKETSKEYIFYLIKKIYLELNTLDNKLNNYDEDIKWLHFKNIVMDARAIHKSILIDHGNKENIDNKIKLLLNKRIDLLKQYI
jgi:hypothetical protein